MQVLYKFRNRNSTVKPTNIQLRFWGYEKNAHSAKSLNLIEIMWKIIPNQVFAKKSSGTHFFLHAKISNFSSKTRWFLRILTCNDYKLNIGPILILKRCGPGKNSLLDFDFFQQFYFWKNNLSYKVDI